MREVSTFEIKQPPDIQCVQVIRFRTMQGLPSFGDTNLGTALTHEQWGNM